MKPIKLFVDSSCDFPKEMEERLKIKFLPLIVVMDDVDYLDRYEVSPEDILEYSEKNKKTPKTSGPNLQQAIAFFEKNLDSLEDEAIFFTISEDASTSTTQVMKQVVDYMGLKNVRIIDTKTLSSGIALMVDKANELIEEGKSLDEVVDGVLEFRDRVDTSFVVDSLEHLYNGGRCGSLTKLLGTRLRVKPCIRMVDGVMKVVKKYRGNKEAVWDKYLADILENYPIMDKKYFLMAHTGIEEEVVERLLDRVRSLNYFETVAATRATAIITSHAGPNTLGLFYVYKG